jgi:hypothetical protein
MIVSLFIFLVLVLCFKGIKLTAATILLIVRSWALFESWFCLKEVLNFDSAIFDKHWDKH